MIGAFTFLAGVLAGLAAAHTPPVALILGALGVSGLLWLAAPRGSPGVRTGALFLGGLSLALFSTFQWQSLHLGAEAKELRLLLEGTVRSVPVRDGAGLRFDAEVSIVSGQRRDGRLRRARLGWRDAPFEPRVGERWRWLVRLAPGSAPRNFAGVDIERMAFRDRVHFSGYVVPSALNARLATAEVSIESLRARIAARISDHVADPDAAALLTALAVGLTGGVSTDQWRIFNATGTTHLVAISGLHVTLFAVLAMVVARWAWRCPPIPSAIEREPFALSIALVAAGAYSLLAGFSVPTQRTWIMLAIFALARAVARHTAAGRTWSLALIAVLLLDVFAPLAAGFWLSFVAVGVLMSIDTASLAPGTRLSRLVRLQVAVMLALAPLTIAVFGTVSLVGLLVNLVAIPFVSFVFVPLVLAGAVLALVLPLFCGPVFALAALLYEWLWPWMVWAADLEFAQWRAFPEAWWFLMCIPGVLLILWRWPWPLRATAVGLVLAVGCAPSRLPPPGVARVSVLDAGRGAAVLIATHTHLVLFDTGDAWNSDGARVMRLVIPALDALGRRRVDLVVLPSLNPDRARGVARLATEREVERVVTGGRWIGTSLPVSACQDTCLKWDEITLQLLAAGPDGRHCALRLSAGNRAILLGGDLDVPSERELVSRLGPAALRSELAIISRQASAVGSGAEWIDALGARRVIAAGGFTGSAARQRVLDRWRRSGAQILDTHLEGAVEFEFSKDGVHALSNAQTARYPFAWRRIE